MVLPGTITTSDAGETGVTSELVDTLNNVLAYEPAAGLVMLKISTSANVLPASVHPVPSTTVTVWVPPVEAVDGDVQPVNPPKAIVGSKGIRTPGRT